MTAKCLDCGRAYRDFGMDVVLPSSQWLEIHPDDGGLLCAQCIVNRVTAKMPRATVIHMIVEVAGDGRALDTSAGETPQMAIQGGLPNTTNKAGPAAHGASDTRTALESPSAAQKHATVLRALVTEGRVGLRHVAPHLFAAANFLDGLAPASPPETPTIRPSAPQELSNADVRTLIRKIRAGSLTGSKKDWRWTFDLTETEAISLFPLAAQSVPKELRASSDDYQRECELYRTGKLAGEPAYDPPLASAPPKGWQPIATAPKDGTRLLLWWPHWSASPIPGRWFDNGWDSRWILEGEDEPPTHWMPLHAPPSAPSGDIQRAAKSLDIK